jgi:hypothetical protein
MSNALTIVILSVLLGGTGPKTTPKPASTKAAANCAGCLETRPTLDPKMFAKWDNPDVSKGYEIAKRYPALLDRIHCFCECQESPMFRHKTLLTCFVDQHAAACGICLREALLASQLKEKGLSDEEIERTVESVNKTDGHASTAGRS